MGPCFELMGPGFKLMGPGFELMGHSLKRKKLFEYVRVDVLNLLLKWILMFLIWIFTVNEKHPRYV